MDGRPVHVLPTDYVDQGVVVPAGHHTLRLTFADPWVLRGLIGSIVAIALVLLLALAAATVGGARRARASSTFGR